MSEEEIINIKKRKEYWERNTISYSNFYETTSEETIVGSPMFTNLYKMFIFPIEKKATLDRYKSVKAYLEESITPNMEVADIGCGNGIYIPIMLEKGANVIAVDYAHSAINMVKKRFVSENNGLKCLLMDITKGKIPKVELTIAIGVLPYIDNLEVFLNNILPYTNKFVFNFLDSAHPLNKVRKFFPLLNVRYYSYHDKEYVIGMVQRKGFIVDRIKKLFTGYMIFCKKPALSQMEDL